MNFASAGFQAAFAVLLVVLVVVPPRWRIWSITLFGVLQLSHWSPLATLLVLLVTLCVHRLTRINLTGRSGILASWFPFLTWLLFLLARPHVPLPLPLMVGPSFLLMRLTSLLVDIRRGAVAPPSLSELLHYSLFFPLLAAGPVERYAALGPQLRRIPRPGPGHLRRGLFPFAVGFFKQMFVADSLRGLSDAVLATPGIGVLDFFWAGLVVTTQVYAEYSAYCEMGLGLALCLGVEIEKNFLPFYLSRTPVELWERWNRSVGQWFKDYVTFPLMLAWGRRVHLELVVVLSFILMGLWHQLSWSRLGFGVVNGAVVAATLLARRQHRGKSGIGLQSLLGAGMVLLFATNGLFHAADEMAVVETPLQPSALLLTGLTFESLWTTVIHFVALAIGLVTADHFVHSKKIADWRGARATADWYLIALAWSLALVLAKFTARPFNYSVF